MNQSLANILSYLSEKLSQNYIATVFDAKSLQQIKSFSFTIWKMLILFAFLLCAMFFGFYFVFGANQNGQISNENEIALGDNSLKINKKITQLESDIEAYKIQVEKLKKIVTGNSSSDNFFDSTDENVQKQNKNSSFILQSPLKGYLTENYSTFHSSVDIAAKKGQKIKATYSGYVIYTGWSKDAGYTLIIQHPNNILSVYKHCETILVKTTQKVSLKQEIATVGNTGELSTGYHLHFELWHRGKPINPQKYIRF